MSILNACGAAVALLLGCCGPALSAYAGLVPILDEVVITATRLPMAVDQTGGSVTVITAEDLARHQDVWVIDALRRVPGVYIPQSGSFGGVAGVKLRGLASEQTLVLIDGVAINDPAAPGGGADMSRLPVTGIKRIEVLRGPQSPIHGSDAMGGVINIVTGGDAAGWGGGTHLEAGSYDTRRLGGHAAYGSARVQARLAAGLSDSDGISKADIGTEADGYRDRVLDGQAAWTLSPRLRLHVMGRTQVSFADFDGTPAPDYTLADTSARNRTEQSLFGAGADMTLGDDLHLAITHSDSRIARDDAEDGMLTFWADGQRRSTLIHLRGVAGDSTWLIGGEYADQTIATLYDAPSATHTTAAFGQVMHTMGALSVNLGLRHDLPDRFDAQTTGRLAARYRVSDHLSIRGAVGTGFKTPSLFQSVYFCCGATGPNPDLRPEHNRAADVGVDWTTQTRRLSATLFWQRARDLIDFSYADGAYININRTQSHGLELSGQLQLAEDWALRSNLTWLESEDRSTGLSLARTPKYLADLHVDYSPGEHWTVGGSLRGRSASRDSAGTAAGYGVVDLRASYRVAAQTVLMARLENLFDTAYQEVFGYGTPGRSLYVGLKQEW